MAGGTLRRPGLGGTVEDLPGQPWIAGQRVAASGSYGPTVAWLPRWAARTRCSGSDDAVAFRVPIALACKASASTPTFCQPTQLGALLRTWEHHLRRRASDATPGHLATRAQNVTAWPTIITEIHIAGNSTRRTIKLCAFSAATTARLMIIEVAGLSITARVAH
jgi:hypothetical protein